MEKEIGNLAAQTMGQIMESDVLRNATAGKLKSALGNIRKAGTTAAGFGLMAMALSFAPAAHADGLGMLGGGAVGGLLGSLVKGPAKLVATVAGAGVGAYAGNALTGDGGARQQRLAQQEMRGPASPMAVGPEFPPNDTPVANHMTLSRIVGGVGGAVVGGLVGSKFGGGGGKMLAEGLGAAGGAYGGQALGARMAGSHPVEPGHATMVTVQNFGQVAASPAPWGQLSPAMAQIEGFSKPTQSLDSNPRAKDALNRALIQLETEKQDLIRAGGMTTSSQADLNYAVSAQEHDQARRQVAIADKGFTDAMHLYLGLGVMTFKTQLDNLALQGYDIRSVAPRALEALDVQVPQGLRLKHASAYNPELTHVGVEQARAGGTQDADPSEISGNVPSPADARAANARSNPRSVSMNENLSVKSLFNR